MAAHPVIEGLRHSRIGIVVLLGCLGLYVGSLLAMRHAGDFDMSEPLLILGIIGIGFSLAAWLITARVARLEYTIAGPAGELATIGLCLLLAVAFITWGLGLIQRYFRSEPANAIAILVAKLAVFFALPAAVLRAQFGNSLRRLARYLCATGRTPYNQQFEPAGGFGPSRRPRQRSFFDSRYPTVVQS